MDKVDEMEVMDTFADAIDLAAAGLLGCRRWCVATVYDADTDTFRAAFILYADYESLREEFACTRRAAAARVTSPEAVARRWVKSVLRAAWKRAVLPDQDWRPAGTVPEDYYAM